MHINMPELLKLSETNLINIIDIRNSTLYNNGHIKYARNIPQTNLLLEPEKYLNKKDNYYIYCQYGTSSEYVCTMLNNKGYKAINIIGGYNTYKKLKS